MAEVSDSQSISGADDFQVDCNLYWFRIYLTAEKADQAFFTKCKHIFLWQFFKWNVSSWK